MKALAVWLLVCGALVPSAAQTPISRDAAIESAITRGARLGIAKADTAAANARVVTARSWQNPELLAVYTKAVPNYWFTLELALTWPSLWRARIASAQSARAAAQLRFALERAETELDADTTYTRAIAARERARIGRLNAEEVDSLRLSVIARRTAGRASDLDVELATVIAAEAANIVASDSLTYLSTVLDLQVVMGLDADHIVIELGDSIALPPSPVALLDSGSIPRRSPLRVAAARADLETASL
ncbi:MAG TPA: TolC family protein, partial [Gemmatimonadaceae bacterium]|nr:TolC family protein [Gemmatimonadaceae bacterium]